MRNHGKGFLWSSQKSPLDSRRHRRQIFLRGASMEKPVHTREQLQRLSAVHKILCAQRNVHPHSEQGRDAAVLLLNKCTGDEPEEVILKKFAH